MMESQSRESVQILNLKSNHNSDTIKKTRRDVRDVVSGFSCFGLQKNV